MDFFELIPSEDTIKQLKAYNLGLLTAYKQLKILLKDLDPIDVCHEIIVLNKYIDAWTAELELKNASLIDFEECIAEAKKKETEECCKQLINSFGIDVTNCKIEFSEELLDEARLKCKEAIEKVLDSYNDQCDDN